MRLHALLLGPLLASLPALAQPLSDKPTELVTLQNRMGSLASQMFRPDFAVLSSKLCDKSRSMQSHNNELYFFHPLGDPGKPCGASATFYYTDRDDVEHTATARMIGFGTNAMYGSDALFGALGVGKWFLPIIVTFDFV